MIALCIILSVLLVAVILIFVYFHTRFMFEQLGYLLDRFQTGDAGEALRLKKQREYVAPPRPEAEEELPVDKILAGHPQL
jgi:cell division protein FtsL